MFSLARQFTSSFFSQFVGCLLGLNLVSLSDFINVFFFLLKYGSSVICLACLVLKKIKIIEKFKIDNRLRGMFGSLPPTEVNFQCNRSAVRFLEASRDHLSPEVHDGFAQDPCSYPPGYTSIDRIRRSSHQGLIRDMPTFTGIFLDLKKKKIRAPIHVHNNMVFWEFIYLFL